MKVSRRQVLRAAGVALALPRLNAEASPRAEPRRRMICICQPLGLLARNLFPEQPGNDYALTRYLEVLKDLRNDFTIISGLSHPGFASSFAHQAEASFLTGVPGAGRPGFRNRISLDQLAAKRIGGETRVPSLVLGSRSFGFSFTHTGAPVPTEESPSRVFARLFLEDSADEHRAHLRRLQERRSVLDNVREQASKLQATAGRNDREKLDEYITSVRELEQRLLKDEEWLERPKPKVDAQPPRDIASSNDLVGRTRLVFDLACLALQSDSTRVIAIMLPGGTNKPMIDGVTLGHHDLSHHGQDPTKLAQLELVELAIMKLLRGLLDRLKQTAEDDGHLLDRTTVFLGSNLGDASSHAVKNLPVLLAGGGFKHGQHLAFDPDGNVPLCNLYVTMLQRLGIPEEKFGSSTGTLPNLDTVGA